MKIINERRLGLVGLVLGLAFFISFAGCGKESKEQPPLQDTTPPDTVITSYPSNPTNSTSATFVFISTEEGSAFECQLDGGGYSTCTSTKTYTGLTEGNHTFEVRAIDSAGNVDSTPATYTWTVDTLPPDTSLVSYPSNSTNSTTATFEFSCDEPSCTFECQLDEGGWETCSYPKTYTNLSAGRYLYEVRAIDSAGNFDPTPASYTWTIIPSLPVVLYNWRWGVFLPIHC